MNAVQKTCSIDGCCKRRTAKGFCDSHYARWRRHGDPLAGGTSPGELTNFYEETVLPYKGDECLIWPYGHGVSGYGQMRVSGRPLYVHRLVCEAVNGPAPSAEHQAAHNCGNALCVNPSHIEWKTRPENEADKLIHGTHRHGERSNFASITEAQAREILSLKGRGMQKDIARRFGVSRQTVSDIHRGKSWVLLTLIREAIGKAGAK